MKGEWKGDGAIRFMSLLGSTYKLPKVFFFF